MGAGSYQLMGRGSTDYHTPGSSVLHYLPLTFMSIEWVMPSNHLILCCLLLWLQSFPTSASSPISDFRGFSLELNQSFLFLLFCLLLCPTVSHMDSQQSPPSKGGRLETGWQGGGPEAWWAMCPGSLRGGSADRLAEPRPILCTRLVLGLILGLFPELC